MDGRVTPTRFLARESLTPFFGAVAILITQFQVWIGFDETDKSDSSRKGAVHE